MLAEITKVVRTVKPRDAIGLLTLLLGAVGWIEAAAQQVPRLLDERMLGGNHLLVKQWDAFKLGHKFTVELNGRQLLMSNSDDPNSEFFEFPYPKILQLFSNRKDLDNYVAVFQQYSWGNACNGGPIWLLSILEAGQYGRFGPIDYCGGGVQPVVTQSAQHIEISLPCDGRDEPSRSTQVRHERWRYSSGKLAQVTACGKK